MGKRFLKTSALILAVLSCIIIMAPRSASARYLPDPDGHAEKLLEDYNKTYVNVDVQASELFVAWYSVDEVANYIYQTWGARSNSDVDSMRDARRIVNELYVEKYDSPLGVHWMVLRDLKGYTSLQSARTAFARAVHSSGVGTFLQTQAGWGVEAPDRSGGLIDSSRNDAYKDPTTQKTYTYNLDSGNTSAGKVGKIEQLLSEIVRDIASGMQSLLSNAAMTIDTAIYGRVNGNGVKIRGNIVAPYTFELEKGNVYGTVGAAVYAAVRRYGYLFMAFAVLFQLCKLIFVRGRQGFEALGGILRNAAFSLFLILMMPYLMEIVLFVRDGILFGMLNGIMDSLGVSSASIVNSFAQLANESGAILDAMLYLVAVCMGLVFTCIYIGVSLEMMIYFITFPVVCVKGCADLSAFKDWSKHVLSLVLIPIVDGVLFLIPCSFAKFANQVNGSARVTYAFIALVAIGLMFTVRKTFFEALGTHASSVGDAGLALGAAASAALGGAVKRGIGVGKAAVSSGVEAYHQGSEAKAYEKMAKEQDEWDDIQREKQRSGGNEPLTAQDAGAQMSGNTFGQSEKLFGDAGSTDKIATSGNYTNRDIWNGLSYQKKAELARRAQTKTLLTGAGSAAFGTLGVGAGTLAGAAMGMGLGGAHGLAAGAVTGAEVGGDIGSGVGTAAGAGLWAGIGGLNALSDKVEGAVDRYQAGALERQIVKGAKSSLNMDNLLNFRREVGQDMSRASFDGLVTPNNTVSNKALAMDAILNPDVLGQAAIKLDQYDALHPSTGLSGDALEAHTTARDQYASNVLQKLVGDNVRERYRYTVAYQHGVPYGAERAGESYEGRLVRLDNEWMDTVDKDAAQMAKEATDAMSLVPPDHYTGLIENIGKSSDVYKGYEDGLNANS